MVTFYNLTINDEKNKMSIECAINSEYAGQDVWIRSIELVYYDNLMPNGFIKDDTKVVSVYLDADGTLARTSYSGEVTAIQLEPCLPNPSVLTFDKGLFYVIVTCDGNDIPDDYQDYVVVPDWQFIYSIGMPFVAHLSAFGIDKCNAPLGFEEFIILWYSLRLAFDTFDFAQIELLWNKFLRFSGSTGSYPGGCPCNN